MLGRRTRHLVAPDLLEPLRAVFFTNRPAPPADLLLTRTTWLRIASIVPLPMAFCAGRESARSSPVLRGRFELALTRFDEILAGSDVKPKAQARTARDMVVGCLRRMLGTAAREKRPDFTDYTDYTEFGSRARAHLQTRGENVTYPFAATPAKRR